MKTFLFDLDGTLTDPALGITNSVLHALRRYGIPEPPRESLYPFIGPPLTESFMKYFGFTEEGAKVAVEVYREHFSTKGLYENEVYPGIPEMLAALKDAGHRLAVASSKPEVFVKKILEHFALDGYFDVVVGSELGGARVAKADVVTEALARLGLLGSPCTRNALRRDVWMVGDREHDVEGARENGLPCIGVRYGYAAEGELEAAGAARIAASVAELREICLGELIWVGV